MSPLGWRGTNWLFWGSFALPASRVGKGRCWEVFHPDTCCNGNGRVEHVCSGIDRRPHPCLAERVRPPLPPQPNLERMDESMDAIMNFLGQTWVMIGMGVALVALIGVMIFLRMKPRDEE